ncbi:hypothetical protein CDAR_497591 [Caerostris darwini]|uniref:Uncharacterized protein n=1 Tax=Caerostris darwini TaxID=1538125 RepID=A0AAV4S5C3_9ARAC|nr:hypothetical protein CDAR_497591 [Caerostris darwini]
MGRALSPRGHFPLEWQVQLHLRSTPPGILDCQMNKHFRGRFLVVTVLLCLFVKGKILIVERSLRDQAHPSPPLISPLKGQRLFAIILNEQRAGLGYCPHSNDDSVNKTPPSSGTRERDCVQDPLTDLPSFDRICTKIFPFSLKNL